MATLSIHVTDWSRSQVADFPEVATDTTVDELIQALEESMSLDGNVYHLLANGEKLNRTATLEEVGVESGDELTIAPEVSAGA